MIPQAQEELEYLYNDTNDTTAQEELEYLIRVIYSTGNQEGLASGKVMKGDAIELDLYG